MRSDPPEPKDAFLRALAEHWDDVLRLAGPERGVLLSGLVAGTVEPDPVDARAAIADELLLFLPVDHPMVDVLRTGVMFRVGAVSRSPEEIGASLAGLRLRLGIAGDDPSGTSGLDEFDREVRDRLFALRYRSPDELRARGVDPGDRLIRLTRPDNAVQVPSFQFADSGEPWPVVLEVNDRLDAAGDPWGVTCWWVDPHSRLDASPVDLLGQGYDTRLLRAVAALMED